MESHDCKNNGTNEPQYCPCCGSLMRDKQRNNADENTELKKEAQNTKDLPHPDLMKRMLIPLGIIVIPIAIALIFFRYENAEVDIFLLKHDRLTSTTYWKDIYGRSGDWSAVPLKFENLAHAKAFFHQLYLMGQAAREARNRDSHNAEMYFHNWYMKQLEDQRIRDIIRWELEKDRLFQGYSR